MKPSIEKYVVLGHSGNIYLHNMDGWMDGLYAVKMDECLDLV
jgi:hypothetical protein